MPTDTPVWFITGCSTGFGRELAKLVLARGWRAVVTAREKAKVEDLARDTGERALPLSLDVVDDDEIVAGVTAAERRFGRIDVLVNNAGYGYQSSVEEGVPEEIRAQFEANVFGLFAMTRAVLPGMRERRRGHIINITSVAGHCGFPGSGYYAASKHAVEGFSDALSREVGPLGIKVTCVAPGTVPHRLGGTLAQADRDGHPRLCRDGRRPPGPDGGEERHAGRRPDPGRRGHDRPRGGSETTASPRARRMGPRRGREEAQGFARRDRGSA